MDECFTVIFDAISSKITVRKLQLVIKKALGQAVLAIYNENAEVVLDHEVVLVSNRVFTSLCASGKAAVSCVFCAVYYPVFESVFTFIAHNLKFSYSFLVSGSLLRRDVWLH